MKALGVEMFIAGERKSTQGNVRNWDTAQLREIAENYNSVVGCHDAPALTDAPIQIGHGDEIAHGWVKRAYVKGDKLMGDLGEVDPNFAEMVHAGRLKKRSISFYPPTHPDNPTPGKWNIRHLAYVAIPSCKGMADHGFTYAEEGFEDYEFGEEESTPPESKPMKMSKPAMDKPASNMIESQKVLRQAIAAGIVPEGTKKPNKAQTAAIMAWAEEEEIDIAEVSFSEYNWTQLNNPVAIISLIFAAQRDRMIESEGLDSAEMTYPRELMNALAEQVVRAEKQPSPEMIQGLARSVSSLSDRLYRLEREEAGDGEKMSMPCDAPLTPYYQEESEMPNAELEAETAALRAETATLRADLSKRDRDVVELQRIAQEAFAEKERNGIESFVDGLISERKILPTDRTRKIQLLLAQGNTAPLNFGEGTDTVSMTHREALMADMQAGKELWNNDQMPTGPGSSPDFSEQEPVQPGTNLEAHRQHLRIVDRARELNLDPKEASDYAEAMEDLGITF
jgi:hypothetical protein